MKYLRYLADRKWSLALVVLALISLEIFLMTQKTDSWFQVLVALLWLGTAFAVSVIEFVRVKLYMDRLKKQMDGLEEKYLFCEVADHGQTQEQQLLYERFYEMSRSMEQEVSECKQNNKDYKEYIETWVHEVKIPIAAAKLILANNRQEDKGLSDEIVRMENYVDQALFYARSNDVEKDYLIRDTNLLELTNQVILSKKKVLREKRIRIDLHDLDVTVASDGKWLAFLMSQIVENSIKYMKDSSEEPGCIEIFAAENPNNVQLFIRDNGIGIKANEADHVFEKGFTGSNGRTGRASTGIGLYLCKKLCDRLEHGIEFASEEGAGTTVTFTFPKSSMVSF